MIGQYENIKWLLVEQDLIFQNIYLEFNKPHFNVHIHVDITIVDY